MFDNFTPWAWVAIAWVELLLAYGGYLLYLNWRLRKLDSEEES